jgi:thiamine biosynthesis lipoprotein
MTTPLRRLFAIVAALLLAACQGKEPLYQEQGYVFGTLVEVSVYGENEPRARQAVGEVMWEFQRLHDLLHAWQPSELSELNAAFAKGESAAISAELVAILKDATQLSQQSQGLFNPAIGGLVQLWGFHADEFKPVQPDEKQVAEWVTANPQMSDISIVRGRAQSKNKFVQVDLGGYAKGYALDRAAELLRKQCADQHRRQCPGAGPAWQTSVARRHPTSAQVRRAGDFGSTRRRGHRHVGRLPALLHDRQCALLSSD